MTLAHDDLRGWEAALLPKPQGLNESKRTTRCAFNVHVPIFSSIIQRCDNESVK